MQSNFIFGRTNPKSPRECKLADVSSTRYNLHRHFGRTNPIILYSAAPTAARSPFREIPRVRSRSFENASFESCRLSQPVRSPPAHVRRRLETEFALPSVRREDKMLPSLRESRPKLINCKLSWAMAGSPSPLLGKCKRGLIVENGSVSSDQRNERHGAH
jgi:hypothetical protein